MAVERRMLWVGLCCVIEGLCSAERPMNSPESDTHAIQKKREGERVGKSCSIPSTVFLDRGGEVYHSFIG